MGATASINGILAQALRTLPGGWIGGRGSFSHARNQHVHRRHHKKVDRCGDQQERDCRINEIAEQKFAVMDGESNC